MLSIPIIAGALMRFPLGVLSQYIGRKNATLVEMGLIAVAMLLRLLLRQQPSTTCSPWACCWASPAPASAWRCRWVRAGSRRSTRAWRWAWSAPATSARRCRCWWRRRWRSGCGWQAVYGVAAVAILIPMVVMVAVRQGAARRRQRTPTLREHVACLFEKDGWAFSLIYGVTFGGFIGLTTFLPTYYYDQFGVSKVQAGQLTMLAAFMGAAVRVVGGWISDRWGGVNTLTWVLVRRVGHARADRLLHRLAGADHLAADRLLRRARRRQWRAVPAGAAALADDHGGGRFDDRRGRCARRRHRAQRDGPVEAISSAPTPGASCCSRCWRC